MKEKGRRKLGNSKYGQVSIPIVQSHYFNKHCTDSHSFDPPLELFRPSRCYGLWEKFNRRILELRLEFVVIELVARFGTKHALKYQVGT